MRRPFIAIFAATVAFACGSAFAQGGDLAGVTMRVLDDVSDIDTVILELDANRGDEEEGSERGRTGADEADSAERDAAQPAATEGDSLEERREREALHEPDDDERSEGKLEDNDVERPAAAPTP